MIAEFKEKIFRATRERDELNSLLEEQYTDYYELALPKLRTGGFIIADNVFWDGAVLKKDSKSDKETMGVKRFNDKVKNDSRVEQVILSIRDGLMLIRKL